MLDDKKILAIELLADGNLTKTAIANKVGVARQTIYGWMDNAEFMEALDRRLQDRKKFVEKQIDGRLEFVVDQLYDLATTSDNARVRADVLKYLIDRSLGKTTTKVEVQTQAQAITKVADDVLELEFDTEDNE